MIPIPELIAACNKDGQRALALTDHGNMFGAIELYQSCRKADIRPIVGCEVYIARQSRFAPHNKSRGNGYHHLTLLARNDKGFKNLIKLASSAFLEGYHFRPRIDRELLAATIDRSVPLYQADLYPDREAVQAVLDAEDQPAARTARPEDVIDYRYVDELRSSGFLEQIAQ